MLAYLMLASTLLVVLIWVPGIAMVLGLGTDCRLGDSAVILPVLELV